MNKGVKSVENSTKFCLRGSQKSSWQHWFPALRELCGHVWGLYGEKLLGCVNFPGRERSAAGKLAERSAQEGVVVIRRGAGKSAAAKEVPTRCQAPIQRLNCIISTNHHNNPKSLLHRELRFTDVCKYVHLNISESSDSYFSFVLQLPRKYS